MLFKLNFRKLFKDYLLRLGQTRIVYLLSLAVGLLSALAAVLLKNAIHFTNSLLTGTSLTQGLGGHAHLLFPLTGMSYPSP